MYAPVRHNISGDRNRIPIHGRGHLRTFGSHFETRMFYFPLHFTHNRKHMECFICRLQKQIKPAILCWKKIYSSCGSEVSLCVHTSIPITFSLQSSRLMATSVPSVIASALGGCYQTWPHFASWCSLVHHHLPFLENVLFCLIIAICPVRITACVVVLLTCPLTSLLDSRGSLCKGFSHWHLIPTGFWF